MVIENDITAPFASTNIASNSALQNNINPSCELHRQIIDISNTSESQARDSVKKFIGNNAATFSKANRSLAECVRRIQANSSPESEYHGGPQGARTQPDVRLEQKPQKNERKQAEDAFYEKHCASYNGTNSTSCTIPQSVISDKIKGSNAATKIAQAIRGILVNHSPIYFENTEAKIFHPSTRWLIAARKKDTSDPTKFNTINETGKTFFDDQGKAYTIVNGGEGKTISELLEHERLRPEFNQSLAAVLKEELSPSAAIQLDQLAYAHSEEFKQVRSTDANKASNLLADTSFMQMVLNTDRIAWAPSNIASTVFDENTFEIHALNITFYQKLEMVISRLAATLHRYPTVADVKTAIQDYKIDIPDEYTELHALKEPVTEIDEKTPIFEKF